MIEAKRILVVDDDVASITKTSQRLTKRGFHVESALNSKHALTLVETSCPDIVLLDIMMPSNSGLNLLESIRTLRSWAELPIIVVLDRESSTTMTVALSLGANDTIVKPINIDRVIARIQTQLTASRHHRELLLKREFEAVRAMVVTYNHEINNPLAVALAYVELMIKTGDKEFLEKARLALLRLAASVKQIAAVDGRGVSYENYVNTTKMVSLKKAQ